MAPQHETSLIFANALVNQAALELKLEFAL